ncbi:MAG: crossover junction endodeoxyribonuclease RuvC [Actinomycetota bacterium]
MRGGALEDLASLGAFGAAEDARLLAYVGSLDDASVAEPLTLPDGAWVPRWLIVAHVVNHGTRHRSELARFHRSRSFAGRARPARRPRSVGATFWAVIRLAHPLRVFDRGLRITQTEQVFDSCVLGVDPGVSALGLAAVARHDRKPVLLFAETVRTAADLPDATRLRLLHDAVVEAIASHRPSSVATERIAWNKNQVSAMIVARATGVILLAAAQAGLEVEEYGSLEVKMAVTGQGNANKAQVRTALERFHGLRDLPDQPDAVDAAAIALCHLTQARLRKVAAR